MRWLKAGDISLFPRQIRREKRNVPLGFTFVELMIAATMFSVLFIGLGSHLRGGLTVWQQTTRTVEVLQRQEAALDRLEHDLAHVVRYGDGREDVPLPPPVFDAGQLRFVTIEAAGSQRPTLRLVTYECRTQDGSPALVRTSQRLGEARAGLEPSPQRLLDDCEALGLRYAYGPEVEGEPLAWGEQWLFPEEVPRLVEATLQLASGGAPQRVMAIPQGSLPSQAEAPEGG